MSRLPAVSGKQLIAALERLGFAVVRQKGATAFFATPMGVSRWYRCTAVRASAAA